MHGERFYTFRETVLQRCTKIREVYEQDLDTNQIHPPHSVCERNSGEMVCLYGNMPAMVELSST